MSVLNVGKLCTNVYLVDDEQGGVVVIDPGAEPERIVRAIGERVLRLILVTHYHADHTGALAQLLPYSEGGWVVSETDWQFLKPDRADIPALANIPIIAQAPSRLVHEGDVIEEGSLRLRVIETPGHTPGSVVYIDDARHIAYTGDTLFAGSCGRCDMYGGDQAQMDASLARLAKLPENTQVLPGHGNSGVIAHELLMNKAMRRAIGAQ